MRDILAPLRKVRWALPSYVQHVVPAPGPAATARSCARLKRKRLAATVGYFNLNGERPVDILAANLAVASALKECRCDVHLSVKAPPLLFDAAYLRMICAAAREAGLPLMFDSHGPQEADRTIEVVSDFLSEFPGTGMVLPARWRRSMRDADKFRDTTARIRIVKGEWADPEAGDEDVDAAYIGLAARLAGRAAPVAVATHDPSLAERALKLLLEAGTPCELEQLRGLPRRRTMMIARQLGVPVRVYVPFGPGWWPYAVDKALARPYLLSWAIKDLLSHRTGLPMLRPGAARAEQTKPRCPSAEDLDLQIARVDVEDTQLIVE